MRKILIILIILSYTFTQDEVFPPDYISIHDGTNSNPQAIDFTYNGLGYMIVEFQGFNLGSYYKSTEIEFKSPSNNLYNIQISGEMESGFQISGSLSEYVFNYSDQNIFNFLLPYNEFEMGLWEINKIILKDFSNNILVLQNQDLLDLFEVDFWFLYNEEEATYDTTPPTPPTCWNFNIDDYSLTDCLEQNNVPIMYENGYAHFRMSIYGITDDVLLQQNSWDIYPIREIRTIFSIADYDCEGMPNGDAIQDNCGVCDHNPENDCPFDCAGVLNGDSILDNCGVCDNNPENDCPNEWFNLIVEGSAVTTQIEGDLAPYTYFGWIEYHASEMYPQITLELMIPYNLFGQNAYMIESFEVIDYTGNSLLLNTNELNELGLETVFSFYNDDGEIIDTDPPEFLLDQEIFSCLDEFGNYTADCDLDPDSNTWYLWMSYNVIDNTPYDVIPETGFIIESPSGEELDFHMYGSSEQFASNEGDLSDYFSWGTFNNGSFVADFRFPLHAFELGTWLVKEIYATDYSGNTTVITNDDLVNANLINTIKLQSSNSVSQDITSEYVLLSWDWGYGDNIIIQESAFNLFEEGDTLYAIDDNALITSDCSDPEPFGPAILDKHVITDYIDEFSLYCNGGIDNCDEYDLRNPGFVEGNPMKFIYYDYSNGQYYDITPEYSSGNGHFGVPFDDTLTFKYYDASADMVYDLEESFVFMPDMIEGDAINPVQFTIDYSTETFGAPDWDFDFHYYEFNGSITSAVYDYGELLSEEGDIIAAFVNSECRGSIEASVTPDPVFEEVVFHLMVYANRSVVRISSFEIGQNNRNNDETNLTSLSDRSGYKYNIYKNDILIEENYSEQFLTDYDINNGENCYEIYLIDNYDNSEFLSTDEVCFYSGTETEFISGDVTQDGTLNVIDIVLLVDWILSGTSLTELEISIADITNDGLVNVIDVVMLVDIILNS